MYFPRWSKIPMLGSRSSRERGESLLRGGRPQGPADALFEVLAEFIETRHGNFFDAIANYPKPAIAAVNGYAVGAGFQIALCCDVIYASDNARFILPQVSLGILPAYGGAVRLARFVGKGRAMEIVLSCKTVDAQEAYRIGIANQAVPLPELMSTANCLAEKLAAMPPLSLRLAKESLNRGLDIPLVHATNADLYRFFALVGTQDRKEGHRAAKEMVLHQHDREKTPQFKGR